MDTQSIRPFVLWIGQARDGHIYRIIDRGPVYANTTDGQFQIMVATDHDEFGLPWMPVPPDQEVCALRLLVERFGKLLLTKTSVLGAIGDHRERLDRAASERWLKWEASNLQRSWCVLCRRGVIHQIHKMEKHEMEPLDLDS